jgi:anti-sigma B factor antagonist
VVPAPGLSKVDDLQGRFRMIDNLIDSQDLLTAKLDRVGTVPIVRVVGEIDLSTVTGFSEPVHRALATGPPGLVIDLQGVVFLGVCGLRVLIEADHRARKTGCPVYLVTGRRELLRPFKVAGLVTRLQCSPSVAAALASVGN